MTEELKPELAPIEGDKQEPTLDEQIGLELVKHNYTEAKLQEFEKYLKLDIVDDDKESYLLIKDKRKEVKSYRVAVEKFCKFKREDAVKIQKAWVSKENELVDKISKVEDYLEGKEKAYEKKIAEEKEARKRKQEEQLILRQQKLTAMGALYSEGNFFLGDVSFEFSAIKESEDDVWNETIYPAFENEYKKIQAEEIEKARLQQEREAELKRQQEELELKQKELAEKEAKLKEEADRQAAEAQAKKDAQIKARQSQIAALGFKYNGSVEYHFHEYTIIHEDIIDCNDDEWNREIKDATEYVTQIRESEAEEKRKEQERIDTHRKRFAELLPYKNYQPSVSMVDLWNLSEEEYQKVLRDKKTAYDLAEEEKAKEIADKAAKAERERIEEEHRQAEIKRKDDLRRDRTRMLIIWDVIYDGKLELLGEMAEDEWMKMSDELRANRAEVIRKQEEERKAEELAQASDKEKWASILKNLQEIEIYGFRSGQYRKKAAILREKLEEIKAL